MRVSIRRILARVLLVAVLATTLAGQSPVPAAAQEGEGWHAEYYTNPYLIGAPALTRTDGEINFDWGTSTPDPGLTGDSFSARWTRFITLTEGRYTFHVLTADGARLFVNEQLVIDAWQGPAATEEQATVELFAGDYALRVEYVDASGPASLRVWWEQAGETPATAVTPTPAPQPLPTEPAAAKAPQAEESSATALQGSQTTYIVRSGDTLARIASRFGVSVAAILAANPNIRNADRIYIGQRLIIPTGGTTTGPTFRQVRIYLISMETGSVGCGDEAVAVRRNITPTTAPLTAALNQLLSLKTQYYGESGLYNALYQSNLKVQEITRSGTTWTVKLTGTLQLGGVCDNPRVQAQLEQTALQFDTVKSVRFLINGVPLEQLLSGR